MNNASCVYHLCSVNPVPNVRPVVQNLPVGARLNHFWEIWAGPKVVQMLKDGYTLPFQARPNLTTSPAIVSCYVHPHRNLYLLEALHQLTNKNAVELVQNQASLGFYNRLFLVPKPNNKWRPILDLSLLNQFLKAEKFKMQIGNNTDLNTSRGVGYVHRLQGHLLPHTHSQTVQKILEVSCRGQDLSIQSPTLWSINSPLGVHCRNQRGQSDGPTEGYKDPPVPRRLVGPGQIPPNLSPTYSNPSNLVPETRLAGEYGKVGTGTRLPVQPERGQGQAHSRQVASFDSQDNRLVDRTDLSGPEIDVPYWSVDSYRKSGSSGPPTHATHPVASQKQLEGSRVTGKSYPSSQIPPPSSRVVAGGEQCAPRSTITPTKTCSTAVYRHLKRRLGRSLKRAHCKRGLVASGKQASHKFFGTKGGLLSPKEVPRPLSKQYRSGSYRQHHSGGLCKQGRGHEVRPSVCPSLEDHDLVYQQSGHHQSSPHPRSSECGSRQAIQIRPNNSDRMVSPSTDFSNNLRQMAPTPNRPFCNQIQQQISPVCVTSTRPSGLGSGCTQPVLEKSGAICLPTDSHFGQGGGKVAERTMQETHSDCPRVAKHALVLESSDHVQSNSTEPAQSAQSVNTALQSDPSQKSDKPESPCMAPRASAIKEQGFSEAVAARIEAPQSGSTRSVYEAKWTIFTKRCLTHQVDFRAPSVKSVADFLMYLFQDRKLQPSTSDGYRSAIADKLGNSPLNISKDENLTRLLDSFHRDRPKGRRGIPSWNLSLVLHQLAKAPFEPMKETSLKHLTFKTVFLLALGSGKRRSEIHAWQNKNIRHQSDWSKVSLYPSPSFLSKKQLAKEGPDSVAPVVIPALAPTLDRSLKSDRSLCPVRALRYYLDRTSDLRQNKELVFVSFKKGFDRISHLLLSPHGSNKL